MPKEDEPVVEDVDDDEEESDDSDDDGPPDRKPLPSMFPCLTFGRYTSREWEGGKQMNLLSHACSEGIP
jgi:hypothetical protein